MSCSGEGWVDNLRGMSCSGEGWVANLRGMSCSGEGWVAKLVARLLATAGSLGLNPDIPKNS